MNYPSIIGGILAGMASFFISRSIYRIWRVTKAEKIIEDTSIVDVTITSNGYLKLKDHIVTESEFSSLFKKGDVMKINVDRDTKWGVATEILTELANLGIKLSINFGGIMTDGRN